MLQVHLASDRALPPPRRPCSRPPCSRPRMIPACLLTQQGRGAGGVLPSVVNPPAQNPPRAPISAWSKGQSLLPPGPLQPSTGPVADSDLVLPLPRPCRPPGSSSSLHPSNGSVCGGLLSPCLQAFSQMSPSQTTHLACFPPFSFCSIYFIITSRCLIRRSPP